MLVDMQLVDLDNKIVEVIFAIVLSLYRCWLVYQPDSDRSQSPITQAQHRLIFYFGNSKICNEIFKLI